MSEHDNVSEVYEELWRTAYRVSSDADSAKAWARALLDSHAHLLAEKQRVRANTYAMFRSETMRMKALGAREVADLIDPEVSG